ncbi:aldo-keto reductase [Ophiostoma piceae UAMH 11346]|uniref:Aldo-keto reductase n=1 Tax=Ophiostoma piceae (strain UAMH 11346) TaxID=1262450 RepID=S3C8V0_OPHP1|nr:aldo-keto reductase [Ophiostoma piceae UAMH 11346]
MVKTIPFGDIIVPSPGFGAMGLTFSLGTKLSLEQAEPVLLKAIELGCTFWDTAVVYLAGINEKLLGDFIRKHNARDKVYIASKCGFNYMGGDFTVKHSPAHIREYNEGTIERLGLLDKTKPTIVHTDTPLEESIPALDEIKKAGKTRYIGLSECTAATLRKANSIAKVDAVQAEYSFFETLHETDGLVDTAKELGIMISPLTILDGRFQGENFYKNKAIVDSIRTLAVRKGCTISQIALAWFAAQGMISIPGTTKAHRLAENWASRDVDLTEDEVREMRKIVNAVKPVGNRYSELHQSMVGH